MSGPPKAKPARARSGLRTTKLRRAYRALSFLQAPVGFLFWKIEQVKARLQDQLANEEEAL